MADVDRIGAGKNLSRRDFLRSLAFIGPSGRERVNDSPPQQQPTPTITPDMRTDLSINLSNQLNPLRSMTGGLIGMAVGGLAGFALTAPKEMKQKVLRALRSKNLGDAIHDATLQVLKTPVSRRRGLTIGGVVVGGTVAGGVLAACSEPITNPTLPPLEVNEKGPQKSRFLSDYSIDTDQLPQDNAQDTPHINELSKTLYKDIKAAFPDRATNKANYYYITDTTRDLKTGQEKKFDYELSFSYIGHRNVNGKDTSDTVWRVAYMQNGQAVSQFATYSEMPSEYIAQLLPNSELVPGTKVYSLSFANEVGEPDYSNSILSFSQFPDGLLLAGLSDPADPRNFDILQGQVPQGFNILNAISDFFSPSSAFAQGLESYQGPTPTIQPSSTPEAPPTLTPQTQPTNVPTEIVIATAIATATPIATETPTVTATEVKKEPQTLKEYATALGLNLMVSLPEWYFKAGQAGRPERQIALDTFNSMNMQGLYLLWQKPPDQRTDADFSLHDGEIEFAREHNMKPVMGQHLVWGGNPMMPDGSWLNSLNKQQLLDVLKQHVTQIVARYPDIDIWSTVNEPYWVSFWDSKFPGDSSWIITTFQAAHAANPKAKLILNDGGIEIPGTTTFDANYDGRYPQTKYQKLLELAKTVKTTENTGISGTGFQMHVYAKDFTDTNKLPTLMAGLKKSIQDFQQATGEVIITEMDAILDGLESLPMEQQLAIQAQAYQAIISTCLDAGVKTICIFGVSDRDGWKPESDPLLFDNNGNPKPAYNAILDVLKQKYQSTTTSK